MMFTEVFCCSISLKRFAYNVLFFVSITIWQHQISQQNTSRIFKLLQSFCCRKDFRLLRATPGDPGKPQVHPVLWKSTYATPTVGDNNVLTNSHARCFKHVFGSSISSFVILKAHGCSVVVLVIPLQIQLITVLLYGCGLSKNTAAFF